MDKLLLWTPTLANVSWVKKQSFPVVDWLQTPFKKETPVATYWNNGEAKKTFPIDKNMLQERWREMSPNKKDPVLDFFNSNAPEWLRIDPEDIDILAQLAKEDYPELSGQERIQKAVEYLPDLLLSKKQSAEANQPAPKQQTPMQWGIRRWVAWNASLEWTMLEWLEPVNKQLDKANLVWRFTQFIDESAQKIPTITKESLNNAVVWTPFEWFFEWTEAYPMMMLNAPGSLIKTATATARGITNPFDTIIGLSKLVMTPEWRQAVIDRYWSIEWLKQTMTEDPVGLASDALTLVQWWAWLASKWAKVAWMTDTASKLGNISNVAWWVADLWLSTVIPQWLQKASQFWNEMWQKWLLWTVGNTVIKWLVEPTQPLQMAKDIYSKVEEIKPVETITRKILWATDDQSKLFKAQEARTGQLNKSIDWKNLRKQSDMANEEIVRYWYKPTDTATRAEAHANTMQKIWDNEIKARIGNEFDIDLNNVADKIDEFVAKQTDAGLVKNKAQLAELQAQSKAFREMWTVDWAKWEFIKEMVNAQINNRGDASIWDVYKNGMKEATRQLWVNLDEAFSRIPWEFAEAKKRFWALKATYADVVKADIKAQKAKWAWLAETFSRIEWFWDLASWIFWMFTGRNPIPQVASWLWKLAVWKVLQKLKDKDFLIQEWFEWLSKKAGQVAPVVKAETNRKALPLMEWAMEFQSPTARIGNTQPRWVDITETGMENVKQPTPLVKSIAQEPKKPIVKADTPKVSPKAKKPLIKADVASKVDDALPVWEKMKLYHWTNEKFESFSNEKLREGAFWKWLYVTNNKESAKRRWNAAKIAKWWEDRVIDIDIPEWTKFKVFDNEADFTKFVKKDFGWDKKKAVNFLQKNYDWLNIKEWTLKANSWTYVIFDPEKTLYNTTPTTTPANWLKPLVKANVSDTSDITSSIKKAKAEGKTFEEFVEWNTYYRWETWWGWNYYSTDFDFARDFTPSGLDNEVMKKVLMPSDIFKSKELPFAWNVKDIDNAVAQAKKQWKKAILVSEWNWQPNSIFVFDKTALNNGKAQLRTERDKLDNAWLPALWKPLPKATSDLATEAKKYTINWKEYTLDFIKNSWAYKSIVESLDNLWVKWYTPDDIIEMLKKTQRANTTNTDWNKAITEIQRKYPRKIKPWKDDLPF